MCGRLVLHVYRKCEKAITGVREGVTVNKVLVLTTNVRSLGVQYSTVTANRPGCVRLDRTQVDTFGTLEAASSRTLETGCAGGARIATGEEALSRQRAGWRQGR